MKIITSVQNPEVKEIVKLHDSKGRKEQGKFIAEGLRVCSTLIASGAELIQFYVTEKVKNYVSTLASEQEITIVSDNVMQKISSSKTPSGILGIFKIPPKPSFNDLSSGIVLVNLADPGNVGTLIRSGVAMGIKTVVLIESTDVWNPKVVQASAGTIAQVNLFILSWKDLLKNKGKLKLCALVVSGGKSPKEINFKDSLLIVGSEAHGIPLEYLKDCEEQMSLPMKGNVESLNAAMAGSIALYLAFGLMENS